MSIAPGITCVDNYRARGRKKTEVTQPQLENGYPRFGG